MSHLNPRFPSWLLDSSYASSKPLQNALRYEWMHPLGETIATLLTSGLRIRCPHENDSVAFQRYKVLIKDAQHVPPTKNGFL
jgi:hypothetical protein